MDLGYLCVGLGEGRVNCFYFHKGCVSRFNKGLCKQLTRGTRALWMGNTPTTAEKADVWMFSRSLLGVFAVVCRSPQEWKSSAAELLCDGWD